MAKMTEEQLAYFRERNRKWREENREKAREASKRWHARQREINPGRMTAIRARYRQDNAAKYWTAVLCGRAEKQGRSFDLTEEFLRELLEPMVCSATGHELSYDWQGEGRTNPWAPSVDRIDSSGGYTMDNVRVVCWAYNVAKNEWADEVVLEMATAMMEKVNADSQ